MLIGPGISVGNNWITTESGFKCHFHNFFPHQGLLLPNSLSTNLLTVQHNSEKNRLFLVKSGSILVHLCQLYYEDRFCACRMSRTEVGGWVSIHGDVTWQLVIDILRLPHSVR